MTLKFREVGVAYNSWIGVWIICPSTVVMGIFRCYTSKLFSSVFPEMFSSGHIQRSIQFINLQTFKAFQQLSKPFSRRGCPQQEQQRLLSVGAWLATALRESLARDRQGPPHGSLRTCPEAPRGRGRVAQRRGLGRGWVVKRHEASMFVWNSCDCNVWMHHSVVCKCL